MEREANRFDLRPRSARVSPQTIDRARRHGLLGYYRVGSRVLHSIQQIAEFLELTKRAAFQPDSEAGERDQRGGR